MGNDDGSGARRYHEATKHSVQSLHAEPHALDWKNQPVPFKIYRDLAAEPLPRDLPPLPASVWEALVEPRVPRRPGELPDRAALARLLQFSLGVLRKRELPDGRTYYFRAAACTGALYHVDAYLVCGALADLTAGVYHFDPRDFSLRRLRSGDWRGHLVEASGADAAVAEAPVTIVLASTYWRNAWKYRPRAYRHVFWDGGTILAQLLAEASAAGWGTRVVTAFADAGIERLCALDPKKEGAIALVPVGSGAPAAPPSGEPEALHLSTEPLSPEEIDYPAIREAHAAGALADGAAARAWRAKAPLVSRAPASGPSLVLAPDPKLAAEPLETAVRRRGSTRVFARRSIPQAVLANCLVAASAPLAADYRGDAAQALVELFVVVNAVAGIPAGCYRWHASGRKLERLSLGDRRRDAGFLALGQALGADAAADVYAIADLDAVLGALGSRGYRAAGLDGGIAGGRTYLAAYAARFGATGLTFFDDDVARAFGLDPRRFGVMFLTAVGAPSRLR